MTGKIHFVVPVNTATVVPAVIADTVNKLRAYANVHKMVFFDIAKDPMRTDSTVHNFTEDISIAVKQATTLSQKGQSSVVFVRGNNGTGGQRMSWESVVQRLPIDIYDITYMLISASERAQKLAFAHRGQGSNVKNFKMWDQSVQFVKILQSELKPGAVYRCVDAKLYKDGKNDRGTPTRLTDESIEQVEQFISGRGFKQDKSVEKPPWAEPWADPLEHKSPAKKTEVPTHWDDDVPTHWEDDIPTSRRFSSRWKDGVPTSRLFSSRCKDDVPTSRRFASRCEDDIPTSRRFASRCEDDLYERVPTQKNFHPRGDYQSDNHTRIAQSITNAVMQRIHNGIY